MNKERHIKDNDVAKLMLEQKPLKDFGYWKLIEAWFPYENTKAHHLLTPRRKVAFTADLTIEEKISMLELIATFEKTKDYNKIIINTIQDRTVKDLLHIHLLKY